MNARGRLTTLSRDGAELASYTYDMSEQRIVKAVAGEAAIHYHYDGEGRLIAETDAATGETIRDYVWLGLTPIASFGADNPVANDNNPEDCTDEIAALEADIAERTTRIDNNAARIVELGDLAADKQSRIDNNAARITELGGLITDKQSRIDTNAARITELGALITDKQSRIANNAARITELEALIVDKQNRIAALNPDTRADRIAELEALILTHQERIEFLTTRNGELAALITAHEMRITELTTRNSELAALITAHETRVAELTDRNAELASLITGHEERSVFLTERNEVLTTQRETFQAELDALLATGCNDPAAGSNVTFLHSDHLGRPKFATKANGEVVWDEGITTPFGIQITAMAAQTQALMFPGQYQDLETTGAGVTLSHNWHRTYDPTLGRYLQSDPIGLAGGLNRYAYVGGNPMGYVDPTGLATEPNGPIDAFVFAWRIGNEAHMLLTQLALENGWLANTSNGGICTFRGRPDLIDPNSQSVYELKPDRLESRVIGRFQVNGYANSTGGIYRPGNVSPSSLGFRGLNRPQVGRFGTYTYRFDGDGLLVYQFQPNRETNTGRYPWVLPRLECGCNEPQNPKFKPMTPIFP